MITIFTTREHIRTVADRWRAAYQGADGSWSMYGGNRRQKYEALAALDPETATSGDVERIIGNSSWTHLHCDCCEADVDVVAEIGETPDYESRTASVCEECLQGALRQIRRAKK